MGILKGCENFQYFIRKRLFFPNQFKLAEVTLVFKKEDELNEENYHPVSVLSHASKIFEKNRPQSNESFYRI